MGVAHALKTIAHRVRSYKQKVTPDPLYFIVGLLKCHPGHDPGSMPSSALRVA